MGLLVSGLIILGCIWVVAAVETVLLLVVCHVLLIVLNIALFLASS